MIRFLLVVFAVVVFVLLAGQWMIHADEFRWAAGAVAAYMAASLPIPDVPMPVYRRQVTTE